jgi:hypothetical protein
MDTIQQLLERELQAKIHTSLQPYMKSIQDRALERIDAVISDIVNQKLQTIDFPDSSIPASKINLSGLRISKSTIQDHVFGAGIEDIADTVQLTVMDGAVVVENDLITNSIKATTVTADTLIVKDFATDQPWYATMKQDVLASIPKPQTPKDWSFKIAEMDAKIQVNASRNQLNELEVSGEAMLSDVLYTTPGNKRVGINTMEPSDALTVWDQETEVVIGKHASQEGYIGTRRRQDLNIGANNTVGLKIRSDGTVSMDKLELLGRTIGSSKTIPGHAAKKGDIVLNDNPTVGGYVGWVCLDGIRWAGYGKIE